MTSVVGFGRLYRPCPKLLISNTVYIMAAKIFLLCFFLQFFPAVVQVTRRVLMLWVFVMICGARAHSCQV